MQCCKLEGNRQLRCEAPIAPICNHLAVEYNRTFDTLTISNHKMDRSLVVLHQSTGAARSEVPSQRRSFLKSVPVDLTLTSSSETSQQQHHLNHAQSVSFQNNDMASPLERLPPELIEVVSDFCILSDNEEHKSLLNLRLPSRTLEIATRRVWRNHYFGSRKVMIDEGKMARLTKVASHPELARSMKSLVVSCVDDETLGNYGSPDSFHTSMALDVNGLLESAFKNLRNVKKIQFLPLRESGSDSNLHESSKFDFSDTFDLIISALQTCGFHPEEITALDIEGLHPYFSISKCDAYVSSADIFAKITSLEMALGNDDMDPLTDPDFAIWFVPVLKQMQSLQRLSLVLYDDEDRPCTALMKAIAKEVKLPVLSHLALFFLSCQMHDLTRFLNKRARSLERCAIFSVCAETANGEAYRDLVDTFASEAFNLGVLALGPMYGNDGARFEFANIDCTTFSDESNDDGYVVIDTTALYHFTGYGEVRKGLATMQEGSLVKVQ